MKIRKKGSGGKRAGAGRPKKMNILSRIDLRLRVSEIAERDKLSDSQALKLLEELGEIPFGASKNYKKYIVPSALPKDLSAYLKTRPERKGILAAITLKDRRRYA